MITVKFDSKGFGDDLEKAAIQSVTESITQRLRSVRCPEHGGSPSVRVKGRSSNNLSFEVGGCCQNLIDRAIDKL